MKKIFCDCCRKETTEQVLTLSMRTEMIAFFEVHANMTAVVENPEQHVYELCFSCYSLMCQATLKTFNELKTLHNTKEIWRAERNENSKK